MNLQNKGEVKDKEENGDGKMHDFFKRHNRKQRKLSKGEGRKQPSTPRKDGTALPPSVQQLSKLAPLQ